MLVARLASYGIFLDIFEGSAAFSRADFFINTYFTLFQWFCHVAISLNRFTVFAFPLANQKVNSF